MTRNAKSGDMVTVHYTGRLSDGTVFDSSRDGEPIEFEVGSGTVIRGVEEAVEGMEAGQQTEVTLEPAEAYGERRDDLEVEMPRDQLPPDLEPEEGMMLNVQLGPGQKTVARITTVADETVTVDLNHPLAGHDLIFDLELVGIR